MLTILTALPVLAEEVTIAALGDSLTQGYGLPAEQGFVPQMQAWLDAAGSQAVLINAGVSGDTTAGGLARVGWTLTPEVDGLIVALGGNDFLRGIVPAVSRANLDGILAHAAEAGVPVLLVGVHATANYGDDYQRAFNGMYAELAETYGAPLFPNFFEGLRPVGTTPAELGGVMQPDGIHPNAEGVALIVEGMGPAVKALIDGLGG